VIPLVGASISPRYPNWYNVSQAKLFLPTRALEKKMIKTIAEIREMDIPNDGLSCEIKGYFFYYIARDELCPQLSPCFLCPTDSENGLDCVQLPSEIGELIVKADETFGMLVGGKYAYYGLSSVVSGLLYRRNESLVFLMVKNVSLESECGDLKQNFKIP